MQIIATGKSISNGIISEGRVFAINDGVIAEISDGNAVGSQDEIIDLRGLTVLPGLVDIHMHGGSGYDTMNGTYEAINAISKYKINEGVTSFMPTTVTASDEMTTAAVQSVNEAITRGTDGAKVLGIFLEGPYINPKNKGAHPLEFICPICLPEMKKMAGKVKHGKVSMAVAPELAGAREAIKTLVEAGVNIRMGHTSATLAEAAAGVEAGATISIHTYNAMSALSHREPGMAGAAMTLDGLYAEIICDLVHVHPAAVKLLVKAQGPDKVILITDCMSAGGLHDGDYMLGELPVQVKDGVCRLPDGTLAGSTANLMGCVRNMHEAVGIPLADAVTMATATPAKALGVYDRIGSLEEGKQADIIAIDACFNVKFVMVDGVVREYP